MASGDPYVDFQSYFLASVLTGSTVMVMHGVLEGFMGLGYVAGGGIMRLLFNLLVSGLSGFVAIMIVDATGLLTPKVHSPK